MSGRPRCIRRGWILPGLAFAGLALLAGCAPNAEFVLHQPFAPPSQQKLKLTCERAYYAAGGDTQTSVLAFPLPGAVDGPRTFVMYIVAPNRPGQVTVAPQDSQAARGFLIQELGALAGRSDFAEGTVRYRKVPLAPRLRRLDVNVRTQDGAEITGQAILETSPTAVESFQREFAADIASLSPPTSQPAEE